MKGFRCQVRGREVEKAIDRFLMPSYRCGTIKLCRECLGKSQTDAKVKEKIKEAENAGE